MATIRIMSGGAPKEIFLQLTPQFEGQSGHKVDYVFAVMSALRDRLAAGEKADVLVMPTNILDGYQKDKIVRAEGRAVLGLVSINAVVRSGAAKPDLSTPEKVKQAILNSRAITHATPGATPSGTHMGKLVEQLGIADASGRAAPSALVGESFTVSADLVIAALGFEPEDLPARLDEGLGTTRHHTLAIDPKRFTTSLEGVFAAGDIVRGASLVVWAIRDGQDAAQSMHEWISSRVDRGVRVAAE